MIAYNHWANGRILTAASKLSPDDFAKISKTLVHTVGTQLYWRGNWRGEEVGEPEGEFSIGDVVGLYEKSDADLEAYVAGLTDEEWERTEAWWKRWGYEETAPVGQTLFQVIYHGIQHRAEVAVILSDHDASPGEMDYLVYLQESAGVA